MLEKQFTIELKCMFCDCVLQSDTGQEYSSGDLLKCQECNEPNDYDSLIDIATEEGKEKVEDYAQSEIDKMLKNIFK